jgi:hypothetical protein
MPFLVPMAIKFLCASNESRYCPSRLPGGFGSRHIDELAIFQPCSSCLSCFGVLKFLQLFAFIYYC